MVSPLCRNMSEVRDGRREGGKCMEGGAKEVEARRLRLCTVPLLVSIQEMVINQWTGLLE